MKTLPLRLVSCVALAAAATLAGCAKKNGGIAFPSPYPTSQISRWAPPVLAAQELQQVERGEIAAPVVAPPPRRQQEPILMAPIAPVIIAATDPSTGYVEEVAPYREEPAPEGMTLSELPMIHFEYDRSELSSEMKSRLVEHARLLNDRQKLSVVLRGHADERGTDEYNMALGSRRAMSVRQALIEGGMAPDRLETVSFGEAMPLDFSDTPEAHEMNRRVEFFVFET